MRHLLFTLILLAALIGCSVPGVAPTPTDIPTGSGPTNAPAPLPTAPAPIATARPGQVNADPQLESLIAQARAQLAAKLGITAATAELVQAQPVDWPDSSLGCPQPGYMYSQIVTPGYLIILSANGKQYEFHGDRTRVSLCEK